MTTSLARANSWKRCRPDRRGHLPIVPTWRWSARLRTPPRGSSAGKLPSSTPVATTNRLRSDEQNGHPVLLLSWDAHGTWRDRLTVADITTRVRGLDAEALHPARLHLSRVAHDEDEPRLLLRLQRTGRGRRKCQVVLAAEITQEATDVHQLVISVFT